MLECGRTEIQVARRFNVARSTIIRLTRRVRETGTFADRPRSDAPRVTTVRQDNYIRQRHLRVNQPVLNWRAGKSVHCKQTAFWSRRFDVIDHTVRWSHDIDLENEFDYTNNNVCQ